MPRVPCDTIEARRWPQLGTFIQSEALIWAHQANDGTETEPRTKEVYDGKQGPEKPNG